MNVPIGPLAVRPTSGATFFTHRFGNYEINGLDYGLELALPESGNIPLSTWVSLTRELLYTQGIWNSTTFSRNYESIHGYVEIGMDKSLRITRSFRLVPGISMWAWYGGSELTRVVCYSVSATFLDEAFASFRYSNIGAKSRDDAQHSFEAAIGVVIGKDEAE
jgi:hypothetical protein